MSITERLFDTLAERIIASNEKVRAQIEAGFAQTTGAVRIEGARPLAVEMTSPASRLLWGGKGRLLGFTFRNGAGAGNVAVNLRNGRDDSADLVASVSIGSSSAWQQGTAWFGPSGVSVTEALWLHAVPTGGASLVGVVYLGATD